MKYIAIKNNGEIQADALHLMGASTKRGDSTKIGQFGSGNKYALAYLIRTNRMPIIYSGKSEVQVTLTEKKFREESFTVINLNGQPTSITVQMGKEWTLWQAMREIICNAMDEGGYELEKVDEIVPEDGKTTFFIPLDANDNELEEFISVDFEKYFYSPERILYEDKDSGFKVLRKSGKYVNMYRKGVRVYDTEKSSAFDYDIPNTDITEQRIISSTMQTCGLLHQYMSKCTDAKIVRSFLDSASCSNMIENEDVTYSTSFICPSTQWIQKLNDSKWCTHSDLMRMRSRHGFGVIDSTLYGALEPFLNDESRPLHKRSNRETSEPIVLTKLQEATFNKATSFMTEVGYPLEYEVQFVRFFDKRTYAQALIEKGLILCGAEKINEGVNELVNTLIEEQIHIRHGVSDYSPEFQRALINDFISYMKMKNSYVI